MITGLALPNLIILLGVGLFLLDWRAWFLPLAPLVAWCLAWIEVEGVGHIIVAKAKRDPSA